VPWLRCSPEKFAREQMKGQPFQEAKLAAGHIARSTSPDDFVFVAGSEPEILCYAQRFSPSRFITTYPLMIPTPLAGGYQQETMLNLLTRPPKVIVFVQADSSWLRQPDTPPAFLNFLYSFLAKNYELTGGYVENAEGNDYWTNHLNASDFNAPSLLLYRRRPSAAESEMAH
jgi:hypothetical protein